MEIIELRSTQINNKISLRKQLKALIQDVEKNNKDTEIKIYSRFRIDTDFKIYLKHRYLKSDIAASNLGQSLVSALKEYGLVNYSIWIELKPETAN